MARTAKILLLSVLPSLLMGGIANTQVQTWTPDHFDPGRAPSISLPSTPGIPVSGGFNSPSPQNTPSTLPAPVQSLSKTATSSNIGTIGKKDPSEPTKASGNNNPSPKPTVSKKQDISTRNVDKKYRKGMVISGHAEVVDGHSLVVDGHPVRLNGIEAPGLAQMCNTASMTVWACGSKASQRLIQLINGDNVTCNVLDQAGQGAAALCSTRSIRDLGEMLVSEGLALPNNFGLSYGSTALAAKQSRKGLFIGSFIHPLHWRLQNPT